MLTELHLACATALFSKLTGNLDQDIRIIAEMLRNVEVRTLRSLRCDLEGPEWVGNDMAWDYAISKVRARIADLTKA